MAILIYGDGAFEDLHRIATFLAESEPAMMDKSIALIDAGIRILIQHPLIGRSAEHGLRELVLSRGKTGYVVLYDYDEDDDSVVVSAIRHMRESGYRFEEDA